MALGLVLNERTSVRFNKLAVDLSFEGAFRARVYADRFPQVSTDLSNRSYGVWVMTNATKAKRVWGPVLGYEWD